LKEKKTAKRNDGARETTRALCGEHEHACKTNRQIKRRESHSTLCERFRREKTLARYKTLAVSAQKRRDARRTKEQKKNEEEEEEEEKRHARDGNFLGFVLDRGLRGSFRSLSSGHCYVFFVCVSV